MAEEHDSISDIISAVEAGPGVAFGADLFGYSFGNRLKRLGLIPEPKPICIGIIAPKKRLSPAAEKILAVRERSGFGEMKVGWEFTPERNTVGCAR